MEPRHKRKNASKPKQIAAKPIADTKPGSTHHVSVYCAICNTLFARPENIYRIKEGCFWVYTYDPAVVSLGTQGFNAKKGDRENKAHCARCNIRVGNIYPEGHVSKVEPHETLQAKFFACQTGTSKAAISWKGDPSKHVLQSAEDAAPPGTVRCELEEQLVREAASLGLLEYSIEHVQALRNADVIRMRLMKGENDEETENLKQFRHMFLKYSDIKTGKDDWEHTQFIVLIASFGLNEKWTKFIHDVQIVPKPQYLKELHRYVEESVLIAMGKDLILQSLRNETKFQLLERLERSLTLPEGSLRSTLGLPVKDLYSSAPSTEQEPRVSYLISLDMKSSNFNVLRLLGATGTAQTWEDLVAQCNQHRDIDAVKFAAKNKWIRVKTLGKIIPKRIKFCQYALMCFICSRVIESQLHLAGANNPPFLFSCDEIIIPCGSVLEDAKVRVEEVLAGFPKQLSEVLRCSSVVLKEFNMGKEMLDKLREQHPEPEALQNGSSTSSRTKPSNGGWSSLKDSDNDDFETPTLEAGGMAGRSTFFIRFDENSRPQTKGIPYYLRFSALKQARLFDPANAFKNIEQKNFAIRDPTKQKCRHFRRGYCKNGENCNFIHEI